MLERQNINGRDVWLKVDAHPANRENRNIIPTQYFTSSYYLEEPGSLNSRGEVVKDDDGSTRYFESPVAALTSVWKWVKSKL